MKTKSTVLKFIGCIILYTFSNIIMHSETTAKNPSIKSTLNAIIIKDDIKHLLGLNKDDTMGRKLYSFQNFIKTKHPALNLSIYLTPKASIYRNATSDAHKVKDISIAEAIRYFCKVNELELNWTENKILIDIKPNPPPETILESKESDINYKTIWVKTIKSNPIKIEVDYLVAPPIINCNGEKFNDVSAVINHLNDIKEDAIIRGILFIYSSKATKKWDNPLLDELIRFTYPQNIDLYLKFCISKKTEYIYRKYLWLTPPSSKIEKHQNGK